MNEILKKRFWATLHAAILLPKNPQLSFISPNEARVHFDGGRLLVVLLDERRNEKLAFENWVKVLLNESTSKEIDVIVLAASEEINQTLVEGHFEAPWPTRLSITILHEDGRHQEITRNQAGNFLKTLIETSSATDLSDSSIDNIKRDIKNFVQSGREQVGQLLSFQRQLQAKDSVATYALLGVIGAFYAMQMWLGGPEYVPALVRMGANSSPLVHEGEYWRLVSSIFLHGSLIHVLANSYVLYALGTFFNKIIGNARFLIVFFVSGVAGSLASILIGGHELSVGASGSLWGLFGLGGALTIWPSNFIPDTIRQRLKRVTLINLVLNLAISFLPMVDIWAHLGGGSAGFLVGILFIYREGNPQQDFLNNVLAWITVGLACLCLTFSLFTYQPWLLNEPLELTKRFIQKDGISIGIPSIISSVNETDKSAIFGRNFDPLQIEVVSMKQPVVTHTKSQELQLLTSYMQATLNSLGRLTAEVREQEIDGWSTVGTSFLGRSGDKTWIWFQLRNGLLISVYVLASPGTPDHLLQNLGKIVSSIETSIAI